MLNLSDCEKLIKTPDFDKVPNLEHLILKGCISLSEVPDSINLRCLTNFILSGCSKLEKLPNIGEDMQQLRELHLDGTAIEELPTSIKHLNGLTLLNLRDCKNLLSLPDIICTSLTALQILNLLGCSNLKELPENLGSLESLQELDASGTAIREVPTSIKHLTGLILFNLKDCTNLLVLPDVLCTSLTSLQILNLSGCSNLNELPENLGSLDFLQELDASGTAISQIPESISELSQLGELFLDDCSKLQSLPRLPLSIRALSAHNCPLLQSNKITVWPSAAVGLGYINCHIDKDKAHAIPDQHLMLPFHQIFFELPLPANRLATDLVSAVADPMTAQTSSALPPPSTPPPKYEVFLSFRGLDTRKGFTDYLYKTLIQNGIHSFRDDEQLDSGEPISTALLKAIEESQISVVILSKNYATSTWCLDELATMVESAANTKSRLILPVFYDVTPSEVREQTGEHFKEAFAQHDKDFEGEPGKVTRWKESLTEIANLSGFDVRGFRYETNVTEEIVKRILGKLNTCHTFSDDLKDFVGINRVHEIKSNMGPCLEEVRVIGICGMPGIGKSTIAKALSQSIRNQFEAFSFISKIGEISTKESLSHIKEQLCDHLLNNKETTKNVDDVICKRFRGKRVLIILDNVDALEQIKAVAGSDDEELSNRFGQGSRIIITTTNDRLLIDYNPEIYRIEKLTQDEALLLFCRKAFKKDHPTDGFEDLSDEFVDYIDGLPLALEVLGSSLWKRSVEEWSSTLASLKDNNYSGEEKIIDILKVSFDGLKNPAQQEIFLDTACFFRGEDACRIKKIFESCGYHPGRNINILCEKYLLSIVGGKLWMHDLLQQMGREIVRRESKKQGERSRLWHHTDALPVLKKNKGTDAVKGIFLTLPKQQKVHLKEDPFSNLDSLRLLKIHNVKFAECLEYLSDELRFLEWHKYPLKYLPSSFEPHKLVELNLCESEIEQLWEEIERPLEKLVILNLSDCEKFIKAPDFNKVPNLEQLILKGCTSLSEVPVSINLRSLTDFILSGCSKLSKLPEIGEDMKQLRELHLDGTAIEELPTSIKHLNGLTLLNLRDCKNLLSLPDIICTSLTALQILNLLGCSNLNELPENLGSLECLQELNASGTAIRELPTSIRHLTGLTLFNLKDCTNLLLLPDVLCTSLTSLQILNLSGCSNLNELPENLGSLDFLQELDASGTAISQVPESISEISQLGELFLDDCSKLQSLPRLPFSIRAVSAHNCPLLQSNKITVWPSAAAGFSYINCHSDKDKAHAIWLPDQHLMLPFYQIFFERTIRHGDGLELGYRSNNIPEWLSRHSIESTITILLPPDLDGKRKWMGLALCFVCVAAQKHDNLEDEPHVDEEFGVTFNRNHRIELCTTEDPHECPLVINYRDCDLAGPFIHWCYIPRRCFAESSNTRFISASIKPDSPGVKVTMCGTSLIYLADVPEFVLKLNKHQEYCYHGNQIKQETTTPIRIVGQLRRNVVSLLGKLFEGLQRGLPYRYDYGFIFPLRERLEWFSEQSSASAPGCEVNLPLPPNLNNDDNWAGLSLYFVCTLPPGVSRTRTFYACHLYAPIEGVGYRLMHRLMLCSPWDDNAGSHRLLIIYIPRVRFAERLNRCRFIHAFVRTPGVEMCGMRLVYNQDLKGLIQTISHCTTGQSAYYGTGDFTDTKKYKGISLGATTLQTNLLQAANSSKHSSVSDVCPPFQPIDFGPKTDSAVGSQHESKTVPVSQDETEQGEDGVGSIFSASGVRTEQEVQEQEYTTSTRIVDQLRRNLVSLLEKLFKGLQGGLPHIYDYGFIFCVRERLQWFSEQSAAPGCTVNLPLPPNLHNDENWAGLSLYVVYTLPSDVELSRIVYECHLCTPIEAVGPEQMINSLELRSHWDDNVGSHRLLIIQLL
ncbi:hypothetical protein PRUPE_7G065500 [Prunus persica]|uniref:TIR domain-containing protein n=2 Tax=Prunus persica TaxID=3760 RepID=A0A251N7P3_PRUPE|nr:hypothetical protein PRUPE_7G065500 [Prunus persica]